jgi:hypothetical protein
MLKPNSIYKHYKGKYYRILHLGRSAADCSSVVIYESLYKDDEFGDHVIWSRSLSEFEELYDGVNPRFEFVCSLDKTD